MCQSVTVSSDLTQRELAPGERAVFIRKERKKEEEKATSEREKTSLGALSLLSLGGPRSLRCGDDEAPLSGLRRRRELQPPGGRGGEGAYSTSRSCCTRIFGILPADPICVFLLSIFLLGQVEERESERAQEYRITQSRQLPSSGSRPLLLSPLPLSGNE